MEQVYRRFNTPCCHHRVPKVKCEEEARIVLRNMQTLLSAENKVLCGITLFLIQFSHCTLNFSFSFPHIHSPMVHAGLDHLNCCGVYTRL